MEDFLKAIVSIFVAVILAFSINRQSKEIGLLLIVFVCCIVLSAAIAYIRPVVSFVQKLQISGNLDRDMLQILLKIVGTGLLAEVTGLICADTGNASLGKAVQILATAVILWLMLPLLTHLLELIETILGVV